MIPDFRMKKEGEIEVSILGRWEEATFPTHQDVMKTLIKKGPQKVMKASANDSIIFKP